MPNTNADTDRDAQTRRALRRQLRAAITDADGPRDRASVIDDVTIAAGEPAEVVRTELAELERAGFVWSDADGRVRLAGRVDPEESQG
jgi:predicted Rossmann fold nucleotide-binding protein DprA/Smf involved in DNA uptake